MSAQRLVEDFRLRRLLAAAREELAEAEAGCEGCLAGNGHYQALRDLIELTDRVLQRNPPPVRMKEPS